MRKHLMMLVLAIVVSFIGVNMTFAQSTADSAMQTEVDSVKLSLYTGITGITQFRPENQPVLYGSNVKLYVAGQVEYPTIFGDVTGIFVYKAKSNPDVTTGFAQVWNTITVSPTVKLKFGYLGRPITWALRPFPVDPSGDFEASGTEEIPGGSTGFRLHYKPNSSLEIVGGLFQKDKNVEYNASSVINAGEFTFALGGYFSPVAKGAGVSIKHALLDVTAFRSDDVSSCFVNINSSPVAAYFTAAYDHPSKEWKDMEVGIYKGFPVKGLKGYGALIGAGYLPKIQQVNFYIWINTGVVEF